ncbi:MAG: hypothetical protein IPP90_11045 [Gemmatimonadaceae bacterium]|nr:hypothetical protein [Gemmatimonadaceae bacterium]
MTDARSPIRRVLREYRWSLAFTYALFGLEMLGSLARPYFLGAAVDGLLGGQFLGLLQLVAAHLVWLVVGVARHAYDTRTFASVYTTFITRLLDRSASGVDVSRRSAYSSLSRDIIEFLQYDLVYVIEAAYNVFGSLIILAFYDRLVVGICLAALLPVGAFSLLYGKRTATLNAHKHDELERQVDIITSEDPVRIREHYDHLRHWQVKLSNQEAWNFGANELVVILVLAASLYVSTVLGGAVHQAGALIALYNYVLRFTTGLDTIPYTIQRVAALRDILRRVNRVDAQVNR